MPNTDIKINVCKIKKMLCQRYAENSKIARVLSVGLDESAHYELSHLDIIIILFANLTLLHSERPKLYGVLAVLSAKGLTIFILALQS